MMKKQLLISLLTILILTVAIMPAMAADGTMAAKINWMEFAATFLYGLMGLFLSMLGYKVYDMMVPFDIHKEIAEDQNVSLGIVLAAIIMGVSIIVAAAIHS
jgi:uncharacterized membrane protein YjfL (UPF0719 family)